MNAVGAGPATSSASSVTLVDKVPNAPGSIAVTVKSATAVTLGWNTPEYDGGNTIDYYLVEYDTSSAFTQSKFVQVDVVNEVQAVIVEASSVAVEEQAIIASVAVTNERQSVRTVVTGVDEVQTITTSADTVVAEVQTITTYANDINEVLTVW